MATFGALLRQVSGWVNAGAAGTPSQGDELGNVVVASVDYLASPVTAAPLPIGAANATAVVVGKAGTANGNGVRNAASRVITRNSPTGAVDATGGITATVTQVLEGAIFTAATAVSVTLPTAAGASGIVQALPGAAVGDIIEIYLCANHATNAITLAAGTGSTIFGIATITNGSRTWRGRITAITANSETITWY